MGVINLNRDTLSLLATSRDGGFRSKRPVNNRTIGTSSGLMCDHCGLRGHLKKNCYRLVGYPYDLKSKRQFGSQGGKDISSSFRGKNNPQAHYVTLEKGKTNAGSSKGHYISDEEYQSYM